MSIRTTFLLFCCCTGALLLTAQNPDSDAQTAQFAQTENDKPASELQLRLGFDSRALVAGRDANVQQYALMPALHYYHGSGLFAGLSGSILGDADPAYTQTTLQAGYGRGFGEHLFATLRYERYFFNPADEGLLQNAIALFANYSWGKISLGAGYTALFEPETAHQLNLSLAGYFEKQGLKKIDALYCAPNASLLAGTETVVLQRFSDGVFRQGTGRPWRDRFDQAPQGPLRPPAETGTQFGPLSLNLCLPVGLQWGRLHATAALNYIVPFANDNDTQAGTAPSNTLFASASLGWTIARH